MSNRPLLKPFSVITNGDMSGNLTSIVTILNGISEFSYQAVWSGSSPVGTITIQASSDYSQDPTGKAINLGTWSPMTFSGPMSVSGNTGSGIAAATDCGGIAAVRLAYTATSGAGTLNVIIKGGVA